MPAISKAYITEIKQIVKEARAKVYTAVNYAMVEAYWLIGRRIVEETQQGEQRANYGEQVIKNISKALTAEFGRGFSERSIRQYRQFYQMFPKFSIQRSLIAISKNSKRAKPNLAISDRQIGKTENSKTNSAISVRRINPHDFLLLLDWTHIQRIMRVTDPEARNWYIQEAVEQSWDVRTLDRNISTQYYERLLLSQVKKPVIKEMEAKTKNFQKNKLEFIKNPTVLEFLGLPNNASYKESILEQAIINQMQKFLLELGKGFAFVERQQYIKTETQDFYIDLVFYNFILKCFVLIELKTHKLTHQDVGQLDMYVRMYDDLKRGEGDNPTIGILLCTETDKTIVQYSVLNESKQLFTSKYMPYLPTEKQLKQAIEQEKEIIRQQLENKEKA
jgi:predicted nuclease of restriction endonuclease-like (RecB) superfamily